MTRDLSLNYAISFQHSRMAGRERAESVREPTAAKEQTFFKSLRNEDAIEVEEWKEEHNIHPSKTRHGSMDPGQMKTRPPGMTQDNKRFMARRASKLACAEDEKYRNDSVSAHDMLATEARRRRSTFKDLLIRPAHVVALDEARRFSRSSLYGGTLNIGGVSLAAENSHTPRYSQTRNPSFIERRKSSVSFREGKRKSSTLAIAFTRNSICTERKGKGIAQLRVEQKLQLRRESKMDSMGTCTYVKVRHILSEKMGLMAKVYEQLQQSWLSFDKHVPPSEFSKLAEKYSECKSSKLGGDLGWIPRAKLGTAGPFQEVAFSTPVGSISTVFRSSHGYHIILVEGRKN